ESQSRIALQDAGPGTGSQRSGKTGATHLVIVALEQYEFARTRVGIERHVRTALTSKIAVGQAGLPRLRHFSRTRTAARAQPHVLTRPGRVGCPQRGPADRDHPRRTGRVARGVQPAIAALVRTGVT